MSKKQKKDENKISKFLKMKRKTVNFAKLLWECMTYKIVLFIIAFAYGIYVFSGFRANVENEINENTKTYLGSMVNESLEKIEMKIHDEFTVLGTMALFYDDETQIDLTQSLLDEMVKTHAFQGISIVDAGKNEVVKSGIVETNDNELIEDALEGYNSISSIYADQNDNEIISLAVPVYDDEEINGVMICSYNIEQFTNIIDTSTFEQIGTTIISQEDGTLVSRPESVNSTNLFSFLDSININNEKSIEKLKKSITNGQAGIITYGKEKHKRYICYNIVPDTNWYSVSIVSADSIEPVAKRVSRLAVAFIIHMCFVVVVYFLITFGIDMNVIRKNRKKNESS
ncbi:MAG: cache domain-containing protein [Lachnospiraceae bacterium]|nr:cache domain-containing protein [Lachnospiraceae bacterium]